MQAVTVRQNRVGHLQLDPVRYRQALGVNEHGRQELPERVVLFGSVAGLPSLHESAQPLPQVDAAAYPYVRHDLLDPAILDGVENHGCVLALIVQHLLAHLHVAFADDVSALVVKEIPYHRHQPWVVEPVGQHRQVDGPAIRLALVARADHPDPMPVGQHPTDLLQVPLCQAHWYLHFSPLGVLSLSAFAGRGRIHGSFRLPGDWRIRQGTTQLVAKVPLCYLRHGGDILVGHLIEHRKGEAGG